MRSLFKLLLAFNSTAFMLIFFLASTSGGVLLGRAGGFIHIPYVAMVGAVLALYALTSWLPMKMAQSAQKQQRPTPTPRPINAKAVYISDLDFIPWLYVTCATSLVFDSISVALVLYACVFSFSYLMQAVHFNPLYMAFGYRHYDVLTSSGELVRLITQRDLTQPKALDTGAWRITDFTYLDTTKA